MDRGREDELGAANLVRFAVERGVADGNALGAGETLRIIGLFRRRREDPEQGYRSDQARCSFARAHIVGSAIAANMVGRRALRMGRRLKGQGRESRGRQIA